MTSPRTRRTPTDTDAPIRLRDTASVVAAVPYLLGHHPHLSLVVVGVRDSGSVGPVMRLDLPSDDRPQQLSGPRSNEVAEQVLATLHANGCTHAVLTVHVEVDPPAHPGEAADLLVQQIRDGIDVLDVVHVGPHRYRSLVCFDDACCPTGGREVADVRHHPVAAGFVVAGRTPAAGREHVEVPATAPAAQVRLAAAAARAWRAGPRTQQQRSRLLGRWLMVVQGQPGGLSPTVAGRLAAAWNDDVVLRDACGLACLPGGTAPARRLLRGTPDAESGFGAVLADPRCAGALTDVSWAFRRLSALAPAADRPGVDACHGWLAWVSGEGTVAGVLIDRVLAADPAQRLGLLVSQCLDHAIGPPWTRCLATASSS